MTGQSSYEPRFLTECRRKYGDAFVDSAVEVAAKAPPLSEEKKARVRRIFAQARANQRRSA